jgi:glycosyltransferase involved in cell wall biosynthesis
MSAVSLRDHAGSLPSSPPLGASSTMLASEILRVAVVTNVLPHYRSKFYEDLFRRVDVEVRVFCQASIPGTVLRVDHERFHDRVTLVPYVGMNRERIGWQRLPWRELLSSFDVLFVLGNPRVLSNLALATWARLVGKPVILWGQAHTAGANPFTEGLRRSWMSLFDHLFLYTDGEVRRWKARGFRRQHVMGMNNGLDQDKIDEAAAAWRPEQLDEWRQREGVGGRTLVLTCTRLEPKNHLESWIEAMPEVIARHPELLWAVIGEGPERPRLESCVRERELDRHVRWVGSLFEESRLAPWFLTSKLLVHPTGIGLSLLHAFGYGLPVVTADDADIQMPEFDAFVPGETGILYRNGDVESLASAVAECLGDEPRRERMGRRARQIAREDYNSRVMVERFTEIAKQAAARSRR